MKAKETSRNNPENSCQVILCAEEPQKIRTVHRYLREHPEQRGAIFCRSAERAAGVARYLRSNGIAKMPLVRISGEGAPEATDTANAAGPGEATTGSLDYIIHYSLPRSWAIFQKDVALLAPGTGKSIVLYSPKEVRAFEKRKYLLDDPSGWETLLQFCEAKLEGSAPGTAAQRKPKMAGTAPAVAERPETAVRGRESAIRQRAAVREDQDAAGQHAVVRGSQGIVRKSTVVRGDQGAARQHAVAHGKQDGSRQRAGKASATGKTLFYIERRRRPQDTDPRNALQNGQGSHTAEAAPAYFDRLVADAVYTLMRRGVPTIFAKNVMELLSGNEALTLRPERKKEVEESIRRLMSGEPSDDAARYAEGEKLPKFALFEKYTGFGYDPEELPAAYVQAEAFGRLREAPLAMFAVPGLPTSAENLCLTHYVYRKAVRGEPLRFATICKTLDIHFPEETYYRGRKEDTIKEKLGRIREHMIRQGLRPQKLL